MRHRVEMTDMGQLMTQSEQDMADAISGAMAAGTDELKADWRGQIERAGLGTKLANTIRGKTYPAGGRSLDPATWVWTKAPTLVDAFDRGPTILPTDGRFYLAIPTANVPRKGRGRMTPLDVEVAFNQDLIIRPGRNGNLLAFVDAAFGRFSRAQGKAYGGKARVPLKPGKAKLVLMFTLVRQARLRKRLDIAALAERAQARFPKLLSTHWLLIPDRTAKMKGR